MSDGTFEATKDQPKLNIRTMGMITSEQAPMLMLTTVSCGMNIFVFVSTIVAGSSICSLFLPSSVATAKVFPIAGLGVRGASVIVTPAAAASWPPPSTSFSADELLTLEFIKILTVN